MAWRVGIDEAGYGPNLGPLTMAAVAVWSPAAGCLWEQLRPVVGKAAERRVVRAVIDDSKAVHALPDGLARLEAAALAAAGPCATFADLLASPLMLDADPVRAEHWCDATLSLPRHGEPDAWPDALADRSVRLGPCRALAVCPEAFNAAVAVSNTKGSVLGDGLTRLVATVLDALPDDDEPVQFVLDRQGGRTKYHGLLQNACPDAWIEIVAEGEAACVYRTLGGRPVTWTVTPRADGEHLSVAWASMVAKYLRELAMEQFNAYWCRRVPGLAPTAGYPLDAKRFYAAIEPELARCGLVASQVWRNR